MNKLSDFSNEINEIDSLLDSEDEKDLIAGRVKTREILTKMTLNISSIFLDRLKLMGLIAKSKRKAEAILQLDREYELISKFADIAENNGEDGKIMEMLIWLITYSGKEKQRQILGRNSFFVNEGMSMDNLKDNLLIFNKEIASNYSNYGKGNIALDIAKEYELGVIDRTIDSIDNKSLSLDLGCADGNISRYISSKGFEKVIGFDISLEMLDQANKNKVSGGEHYSKFDLMNGIPVENNSVDLIVSNLGTASQINTGILINEISRVLNKGGKAILSFYNSESLITNTWTPFQNSLLSFKNPEDDTLEIPTLSENGNKFYKVYSKSISAGELQDMAKEIGLKIDFLGSHGFLSMMMPPNFYGNDSNIKQIKDFEFQYSNSQQNLGTYITVVLSK